MAASHANFSTTYHPQIIAAENLPWITPQGEDWLSEKVFSRYVKWFYGELPSPHINTRSFYDQENDGYVRSLLTSGMKTNIIGKELGDRMRRHATYLKGDTNFQPVQHGVVAIYNRLADLMNVKRVESYPEIIVPQGEDWSSKKVLSRFVQWFNGDLPEPLVWTGSHYDFENQRYIVDLLKSGLDPIIVGRELDDRTMHHMRYLNGDVQYQEIRKELVDIYNSLAKFSNKKAIESSIEAGINEENLSFFTQLLDFNFNPEVVGKEIGERAKRQMASQGKLDCDNIQMGVIGVHDQVAKLFGKPALRLKDTHGVCTYCPIPGYWDG